MSTALALSSDSMLPTRENMTMYLRDAAEATAEKSGKVMADSRLPGRLTRKLGPTEYTAARR